MKKIVLIAMLFALATGSAFAQGSGSGNGGGQGGPGMGQGAGKAGNPVDRLTELLGLSDAQAAAIAIIFEEAQLLREEERERARAVAEEHRAYMQSAILAELTLEQAALYEAHQAERAAFRQAFEDMMAERRMRGSSGGGAGGGGFGGAGNPDGCGG
jgi:Spy/CpxP family protein refolding chaperone